MASVQTPSPARNSVAFYASLDAAPGVALRTAAGTVHFLADATGLWTDLTDSDAPRLTLNGRCDVADAQLVRDGDRVTRCSQTLQPRKAA